MDKKILMLTLLTAGNVFGMNEDAYRSHVHNIQQSDEVLNRSMKLYYDVYDVVYNAATKNTKYDYTYIHELVEQILAIDRKLEGGINWKRAAATAIYYAKYNLSNDIQSIENVYNFELLFNQAINEL